MSHHYEERRRSSIKELKDELGFKEINDNVCRYCKHSFANINWGKRLCEYYPSSAFEVNELSTCTNFTHKN